MSLPIVCPAGTHVSPPSEGDSVVCGVLEQSNQGANVGGFHSRGQLPALISGRADPKVVLGFCCGPGVPGSRLSYCSCVLWRAEKQRLARGDSELRDELAQRPPEVDPELAEVVRLAYGMGQG
jgi:hypothetical protein